jgi:hypothetical protein
MYHAQRALTRVTTATLEDVRPGAVLWHVFGIAGSRPVQLQLLTGPVSGAVVDAHQHDELTIETCAPYHACEFSPRWFIARKDLEVYPWCPVVSYSLRDCGIGADYNGNRLFTTLEEAHRYSRLLLDFG